MPHAVSFLSGYRRRVIDDELDALFPQLPAILIDGPKGVGKTATASQRCLRVRRLDVEAEAQVVQADPGVIAADPTPLLIDEWQRVPGTFDVVRRLVDADPSGGRFMLTGSAPIAQTHSGAGRITTMRMRPLTLLERGVEVPTVSLASLLGGSGSTIRGRTQVGLAEYAHEVLAGGFPGLRHLNGSALNRQLDSYLDRIVDHDLAEAGLIVRRPATVAAWLRAYAAATGTTASWEKIRDAATSGIGDKPAKTTTLRYIEMLTALRILDPLEAWAPSYNRLRTLTQHPKHYLADPALSGRLVRRSATQLLRGDAPDTVVPRDGGFLGGLFEALAALSVRTFAQRCDARVHHLRTEGGRHEVDFIVEGDSGVVGLEAKLASAVTEKDVKHLMWLRERIGSDCIDLAVLHTGPEAYRRPDGVAVIPLALLGP
jgi:predicted AAA+ superfamily ATPase